MRSIACQKRRIHKSIDRKAIIPGDDMVVTRIDGPVPESVGSSLPNSDGEELIVRERHTLSCPASPNCVSTMAARESHAIAPYRYQTALEEAKAVLRQVLGQFPGTKLIREDEDYLHFQVRSYLFGFVDDVEFLFIEDTKTIHFRSAALSGYYDFGVNRKRMEDVRQRLESKL